MEMKKILIVITTLITSLVLVISLCSCNVKTKSELNKDLANNIVEGLNKDNGKVVFEYINNPETYAYTKNGKEVFIYVKKVTLNTDTELPNALIKRNYNLAYYYATKLVQYNNYYEITVWSNEYDGQYKELKFILSNNISYQIWSHHLDN